VDDELVVRAAIRDELSQPLEDIRDQLARTGREAEESGRKASRGARGFDALTRGIGSMVRGAGRVAVSTVVGLGAATLAAGGAAATFGIKTAASMQGARIAFETMLGSATKADRFLRDLSAFAAKTPFEFPELQTAASSLISAGIEADKVIPIMTTLGDVTSGMGTGSEGIQRATVALQQMNAAQKVNAEDLNQLRDAGIPVYDLLAASLGKTKQEVAAMAANGTLGLEGLNAIMSGLESGKGLERFTGLMEKQSASLSGVWSTLSDTVGMGLATALQPAVPVLTDVTLAAADAASKGAKPLAEGVAWLVEEGKELYASGDVQRWAGSARDYLVDLWTSVGPLVSELLELGGDALPLVGKSLGVTVELIKVGAQVLAPLLGLFNDMPDSAKKALLLGAAIYFVSGKLGDLSTRGGEALERLKGVDRRMALMRGAAGLAGGAMLTFAGDVGETNKSLGDAMTLVGSMATGFAAGGPLGLALGTLGGVFTIFTQHSKDAAAAQDALNNAGKRVAETLDRQTGAVTELTRSTAAKELADAGVLKTARDMGIPLKTVLDAALGSKSAIQQVTTASEAWADGLARSGQYTEKQEQQLVTFRESLGATSKALDNKRRKIDEVNAALGRTPTRVAVLFDVDTAGAQQTLNQLNRSIDKARSAGTAQHGQTASGDTRTSRARGRHGIGRTLAAHNAIAARSGARTTITNAFMGGGGRGRGSGDHQAGRALDLQGSGLHAYAREVRAGGGFAEFHGQGSGRHLHAVPAGDTATSRASSTSSRATVVGGSSTVPPIVIAAGAIVVTNPSDTVDLEQGIADGIERYLTEREERS
jgi:tape measure domain-containing protein